MYILGLSFGHDGAASLIKDGKLVSHIASERITRVKKQRGVNRAVIKYVLDKEGIKLKDVSLAAIVNWYWDRDQEGAELFDKEAEGFSITTENGVEYSLEDYAQFYQNTGQVAQGFYTLHIGDQTLPCMHVDHHLAHTAYAYYMSPFKEALSVSVDVNDNMGNNHSVFYFNDSGKTFRPLRRGGDFPVGAFYSQICDYLGFYPSLTDAGKVMALAAYGEASPEIVENVSWPNVIQMGNVFHGDQFTHILCRHGVKRLPELRNLFPQLKGEGGKPDPMWLKKEDWESDGHKSIAANMQAVLEISIYNFLKALWDNTGKGALTKNLCISGGTFLNCVSNGKLLGLDDFFEDIYAGPACGDDGISIGAAMFLSDRLKVNKKKEIIKNTKRPKVVHTIRETFEGGVVYSKNDIDDAIPKDECNFKHYPKFVELCDIVTEHLGKGKVIGWFQDGSEIGPRALCHRSILADPRNPKMKDTLNKKVKHREEFRPFAPVVLAEEAFKWFKIDQDEDLPYMLFSVIESASELHKIDTEKQVPSALHIDGSSRIQTVDKTNNLKIYLLLSDWFNKTECPMLINTSFNVQGQPIVETPEEAIKTFQKTNIDVLVIGNYIITKKAKQNV